MSEIRVGARVRSTHIVKIKERIVREEVVEGVIVSCRHNENRFILIIEKISSSFTSFFGISGAFAMGMRFSAIPTECEFVEHLTAEEAFTHSSPDIRELAPRLLPFEERSAYYARLHR